MEKAAIKQEQSHACMSFAEREQARCETSIMWYMMTGHVAHKATSCPL